ncbi:ParB/RepB/Spo0J family partition protein [Rickettsiales endosymbiont of Peranema trichophorum]|uniref:ParB/RepB/Spo0J family partition protein n=1 Tax=Rickettsiales endosymbiont of Peranema trichophorum TaxID=2486577 RepID=UPI001023AAA8|nr:ParB/RepB/Spo0J family partition protein [Rickettsiales endosymbiont of Peranema trichophorum]RZI47508.1 ParB/RepB/Spo0J family partition protein [Rickettsiales endosymbiont of Peranema trichophorum]
MPTIDSIKTNQKTFKKRAYRPWDIDATGGVINQPPSPIDQGTTSTAGTGSTDDTVTELQEQPAPQMIQSSMEQDTVLLISPYEIKNWEFHDRPANELGDIQNLAKEFKDIGQQQPCIVRPAQSSATGVKYELIVGERRWHAAKLAQVDLRVIVKHLTDTDAAIIQASENLNRKGLSDYARGMSYAKLISNQIITQKELTEKLSISKQQVSRLLSFSKIPKEIHDAIEDFSRVTLRTAEQIKQLSSRGSNYIEAIILLKDKIRDGKIGYEKLKILVEQYINTQVLDVATSVKVSDDQGRHLFTWRLDSNLNHSIHFPSDISVLIRSKTIDINTINNSLIEVLNTMLVLPKDD